MSKKQYKRGKQIRTMSDFDESPSRYYIVYFGSTNPQTKHRSFLMSWQYRTLLNFIIKGWVFEADRIIEAKASEVEDAEVLEAWNLDGSPTRYIEGQREDKAPDCETCKDRKTCKDAPIPPIYACLGYSPTESTMGQVNADGAVNKRETAESMEYLGAEKR